MNKTTRRLSIDPDNPAAATIAEAAAVIRAGGLVAFPTETVYGLGANAFDATAVEGIFAAKERLKTDPLIVHIADAADLASVVAEKTPRQISKMVQAVARHIWPGPLTIVVPRHSAVPPAVTAGRETVAVRMPRHPVILQLIRSAGTPIAAPSANRFGHTSPTTADHVLHDLDGRIDMVLDGGPTLIGLESTVLDLTGSTPTVLRPGQITFDALTWVLERDVVLRSDEAQVNDESMPAPGMLKRHYAPTADLWVYSGPPEAARAWLHEQIQALTAEGKRVGLLVCNEDALQLGHEGVDVEQLGPIRDLDLIAQRLYAGMRALDARRPDIILARDFGTSGLALALSDRLLRAARRIAEPG